MRARPALHAAVIAVVTTVAYAGSFSGEWISDDTESIARNPLLRSLAPTNLWQIATTFDAVNYMPLKVLSLAIDYQLFGTDPAGYHAVNLAIHIANALLVYVLLRRLGEGAGLALAVALVWAVHPVQVESVAWISERKNVLSMSFFMLAFLAYVRFSDVPRARTYALILVLFACALLTKINTIVLPALTVVYELTYRRRLRTRDVVVTLPMLAIGAVLAWVNLHGNPSHGAFYHGGSFWVTMRTTSTVVPRYLALILAPVDLASYYSVPLRGSWLEPTVLASTLMIVTVAVAAAYLVWRRTPAGFWLAWFLINLAPMLNLVPFPALMADRYLYIALLGPLVLIAWAIVRLARRLPTVAPVAATAAVLLCTVLTLRRVPDFHDELALWADWALNTTYIAADRPYAGADRSRQQALLRAALEREPDSGALHNNIGSIAFEEGRIQDALAELTRAHALAPRDPAIALNLGRAYLFAGQPEAAARTLEDAARLEPPSYYAHLNLARAYITLGNARGAADAVARAREIHPQWFDLPPVVAAVERLQARSNAGS